MPFRHGFFSQKIQKGKNGGLFSQRQRGLGLQAQMSSGRFLHFISMQSENGSVLNLTLQFSVLQVQSNPVSGLGGGFGLGGLRQQGGAHLSCSTVFK